MKSTFTDESRKQKGDTQTCLFCGLSHYFRPVRSRDHLGVGIGSKKVYRCNPYPEHIERHAQVVKELKERDEHDKIQTREVVKRSLKSGPGAPSATVMKLQYEEMRIACKASSHNLQSDMNDREPGAFHGQCMKSDMHVWINTFFKPLPPLKWLVLKVVLLPCSACACEHRWSIEGWIHSKRRNRLGQ